MNRFANGCFCKKSNCLCFQTAEFIFTRKKSVILFYREVRLTLIIERFSLGRPLTQSRRHRGGRAGRAPLSPSHFFFCSKKKIGKKSQKRKSFKAKAIKRLPPRSKCYCFSHSRASRIQKFFLSANHGGRHSFSAFHGPSTLKSILPALLLETKNYQRH